MVLWGGGRRGAVAVEVQEAGLRRFQGVEVSGRLLLVAGLAEEHQLVVVLPLGQVEVLRPARLVGAHHLVLALEDGP